MRILIESKPFTNKAGRNRPAFLLGGLHKFHCRSNTLAMAWENWTKDPLTKGSSNDQTTLHRRVKKQKQLVSCQINSHCLDGQESPSYDCIGTFRRTGFLARSNSTRPNNYAVNLSYRTLEMIIIDGVSQIYPSNWESTRR